MPRIPPYQQQVQIQGTPGGMLSPSAPEGAFGAGLGQGLRQGAAVVDQDLHRANITRVEDSLTQAQQQALDLKSQANTVKGINVLKTSETDDGRPQDLTATGLTAFDQRIQELSAGLANDQQRRMFQQNAQRFRLDLQGHLQAHQNQQSLEYEQSTFKGALAVADQDVAQNAVGPDGRIQGATIANNLARKVFAVDRLSDLLGDGPEMRKARMVEAQSGTHALVLGALLKANNPQGAQAYFDVNRDQLDPSVIGEMEAQIRKTVRSQQVDHAVDEVWAAAGPKGDMAAVNLDAMSQEIRKRFSTDAETQKIALANLKDRAQEHDYSVRQREDTVQGTIWGQVLAGKSLGAIRAMPEFKFSLDGTRQAQLVGQIEAFRKRNDDEPGVQLERNLAYYTAIHDPNFPSFTDNQIRKLAPSLGTRLTVDLLKELNDVRMDPNKWGALKVDQDQLKDRAWKAGLVSDQNNPTAEDRNLLSKLEYQIKRIKQASGKPWTLQDTETVMDRELEKVVTEKHWYGNSEMYLFQVEDQVPQNFIKFAIQDGLKTKGRVPSKKEIVKFWFDAKERGLVDNQGNPK